MGGGADTDETLNDRTNRKRAATEFASVTLTKLGIMNKPSRPKRPTNPLRRDSAGIMTLAKLVKPAVNLKFICRDTT